MAAAEYFSSQAMTQTASSPRPHYQPQYAQQAPQQYSQPPTSHPNHSNMQLQTQQPPPPYQEFNQKYDQRPGVHFAPTPTDLHQRHSFSGQRPPQQSWNSYGPPTQAQPQYQHRPSQDYGSPYGSSPSKPQFLAPHMRPYAQPNSSQYSLESGGYSSDPEPHRRRHKHRTRRDSGESRDLKSKSKSRSTNADAFLGAAGGGLIGDLIFPGLGTVGGAAIGWLGGKDYGSHRKGREDKRAIEQRKWEEKFGSRRHRKSRSRGHSGGSSQLGERDDYDDRYDRRHSGY